MTAGVRGELGRLLDDELAANYRVEQDRAGGEQFGVAGRARHVERRGAGPPVAAGGPTGRERRHRHRHHGLAEQGEQPAHRPAERQGRIVPTHIALRAQPRHQLTEHPSQHPGGVPASLGAHERDMLDTAVGDDLEAGGIRALTTREPDGGLRRRAGGVVGGRNARAADDPLDVRLPGRHLVNNRHDAPGSAQHPDRTVREAGGR